MYSDSFYAGHGSGRSTQVSKPYPAFTPFSQRDGASGTHTRVKAKPRRFALPQELVDVIIDFLSDDQASLQSCALVARAWRRRSQIYIHRTLQVSSDGGCQRAERLYSDSFLASCIRELHIMDFTVSFEKPAHHWPDEVVPAMLSTLNQVHPLAISAVILTNVHDIDWSSHPEPLFPHATKLTASVLTFHAASEFAAFMRHFPRLTSLSLAHFSIDYATRDIEAPGPRPPLRKLEIYSSTGQEFFMNWFLHQPAQNIRLETFLYSVERWQLRAPQSSLRALGASVKDLTIVFAFESPHYLLKGDPILSSLSSLRSLTFDLSTLYSTLYGPPSIPVLLQELPTCARISSVRFKFALDAYPTSLDAAVEKLERIRLAKTDLLLRELLPFSELQELLIQVRSDEWARLKRLRSVDAWVAHAERRQKAKEPYYTPLPFFDASDSTGLEALLNPVQNNILRLRDEYDMVHDTWRKVMGVFQKAFPTMAARKMLRVEPLGDAPSERMRWQPRHYDTYQYEPAGSFYPHITLYNYWA